MERRPASPPKAPATAPEPLDDYLRHIRFPDRARLSAALLAAWSRSTPVAFLETVLAPLVRAIGDAWSRGAIHIRHEHFASDCLSDFLRGVRQPWDQRATGPLALVTTLPGEQHGLGIQMTSLVLAVAGWRVHPLGTETPVDEVVAMAGDLRPRAVALSVSAASPRAATRTRLLALRRALPRRIVVLTGGAGAPPASHGMVRLDSLAALEAWARARHARRGEANPATP